MIKNKYTKKVMNENSTLVFPNIVKDDYKIRTFSLTPDDEAKLNRLRAKYRVSRSALIRILLNNVIEGE